LPIDKDINDISKEEFENAIKNIQKISWQKKYFYV
jgi:hypothetical protein